MIYKNILVSVIVLVLLGFLMTATSPDNLSAPLLGLFFMLLYVLVVSLLVLGMQLLKAFHIIKFPILKMIRLAAIGSIVPIFVLLLHSIGQLTVRDVLLVIIFFALLHFYFSRMNSKVQA